MGLLDDAIDLVIWYESRDQPLYGTHKSDAQIAEALGWFRGGGQPTYPIRSGSAAQRLRGGRTADGDVGRVRRARAFVDKNNHVQPFLGYSFGTKRNGAGVRFSSLNTPKGDSTPDAVDESASEQIGRAVQLANQAKSEQARQIGKLNELEESYKRSGKYDQALVIHDAAKELEMFGQLTMTTIQSARTLGVLAQVSEP